MNYRYIFSFRMRSSRHLERLRIRLVRLTLRWKSGKGSLSAGNYSMTYIYDKNRRVVKNAKALGMIGQELEDKVSSTLIRGWYPGMRSEGTIKHVYVFCHRSYIILCSISLVTEPEEFFNLMVQIMRTTKEEGMFTLSIFIFYEKMFI